jgi:hypothetical protein
MVSRPVCFDVKHTSGAQDQISYCQRVAGLLIWGALSDERTGPSFTVNAGLASAVIFTANEY